MTPDQDIEGVLDRWFTEGATRMPSRFFDETLELIDQVPAHRVARLQTRFPAMRPALRYAAVAAVLVTVAGLGAAVLIRTAGVGNTTPAGTGLLPSSGQVVWRTVGTRHFSTLDGATFDFALDIVIAPTTITIPANHGDILNSVSLVGQDRLDLRILTNPVINWPVAGGTEPRTLWHCQVGDAGTYSFSISSGDRHLTLTPVSDACTERATILTGDLVRTDLGVLASGRHLSPLFRPLGGGSTGQFSYTVPSGWTESNENPTSLGLAKSIPGGPRINLQSSVVPNPQGSTCADPGVVPPTRSSVAFAQWLATIPHLVVTTPTPVTIGGLNGLAVDLSTSPGWNNACDGSGIHTFGEAVQPDGENVALIVEGTMRYRYYLLDAGQGVVLLIAVAAPDQVTFDVALAEAGPVIQSFEFAQ